MAVATLALCAIAPRHLLRRHNAVILSLLIGYVILQNVFAELTLNDVENSVAYVGLLNASAFILLTRIFWTSTQYPVVKWIKRAVPILAALVLFGRSSMVVRRRTTRPTLRTDGPRAGDGAYADRNCRRARSSSRVRPT